MDMLPGKPDENFARAEALLRRWMEALPAGSVTIELTCHDGPPDSPGSAASQNNWSVV